MRDRSIPSFARVSQRRSSAATHNAGGVVTVTPSEPRITPLAVPNSGNDSSKLSACSKTTSRRPLPVSMIVAVTLCVLASNPRYIAIE